MLKKYIQGAKIVFSVAREAMGPTHWMPFEVVAYIDEYAKAHPEKKMTKHLTRKLEREYWRSVRAEAKKQKKP